MSIEVRPCRSVEEVRDALNAISHYFGHVNDLQSAERFTERMDVDRVHAAWDGDRIVAGAGAFTYLMSVPGGAIPTAGVTIVGVLPTHRRRGVLTQLMREQLADCRARGEVAAYLWASEATIYPRFGYGLAALMGDMSLARERTAFAQPFEPRGTVRLVDVEEAARTFPRLYEQVFAQRPGMFSRSKSWWEGRRLVPPVWEPKAIRQLALLELDGEPAGYAIYVVNQEWAHGSSAGKVTVVEAVAPTPDATRELWRWLLDFDWTSRFEAAHLPLDHPLFLLLAEPRRMRFEVSDGIWLRLIDVEAALAARGYQGDTQVVVELTDAFLPENAGRFRLGSHGAERTTARGAGPRRHRARLGLPRRLLVLRPRAGLAGHRARPRSRPPGRRAFRNRRATMVRGSFLGACPSRHQAFRRLQSLFWGRNPVANNVPSAHGSSRGLGREGKT